MRSLAVTGNGSQQSTDLHPPTGIWQQVHADTLLLLYWSVNELWYWCYYKYNSEKSQYLSINKYLGRFSCTTEEIVGMKTRPSSFKWTLTMWLTKWLKKRDKQGSFVVELNYAYQIPLEKKYLHYFLYFFKILDHVLIQQAVRLHLDQYLWRKQNRKGERREVLRENIEPRLKKYTSLCHFTRK